jgi:hypothetical protein
MSISPFLYGITAADPEIDVGATATDEGGFHLAISP